MYKILGTDLKEYGPVSAETIRQWLVEGRVNDQTMAQAEGSPNWKPLSQYPELIPSFAQTSPPPQPVTPLDWAARVQTRDYHLEIGDCFNRGWNLTTKNFSVVGGAAAIFLLIQLALTGLGAIPIIGILASIGSLFVMGPLTAGLYAVFLKVMRGQPATFGEVFSGFGPRYGQLLLAYLIPALLTAVSAFPGAVLIIIGVVVAGKHHGGAGIGMLVLGSIVTLIPLLYLSVSWGFTMVLVLDKNLDFWPAMQTSRKMTGKHFGLILVLMFLVALVAGCGVIGCCVGLFFTVPVAFGALVRAYEVIFDGQSS